MSTELIINASLPETRIALMEEGEIQDIIVERATGKGIVGNIYKGRVTRVLPGMQAAFVDIGLEKAAFLYVDDVFVRSEIWEMEEEEGGDEGPSSSEEPTGTVIQPVSGEASAQASTEGAPEGTPSEEPQSAASSSEAQTEVTPEKSAEDLQMEAEAKEHREELEDLDDEDSEDDFAEIHDDLDDEDEDEDKDDDDQGPVGMGPGEGDGEGGGGDHPEGTLPPEPRETQERDNQADSGESQDGPGDSSDPMPGDQFARPRGMRRSRRGRRGGRNRKRGGERGGDRNTAEKSQAAPAAGLSPEEYPESLQEQLADHGHLDSDRSQLDASGEGASTAGENRPPVAVVAGATTDRGPVPGERPEFREQRGRDRRIRSRPARAPRAPVNIQDLLKEGQEVLVQVAKDPIATKGARLTCHISLPGRHLVCMPTIDHVGVSRRIERDDERRKLRDLVEKNRPRNVGFIVRTASGRGQSEKRIKQDIEYLTRLWTEIREKAAAVTAPAMVYEDLNPVLRAIRDWVTEDIDRIVVDSRYHYNEIQRFVSHFMPVLRQKVELYQGDVPIFDTFNISTELARALERKVWLKSGGYLVIDQAEALVAIDVNTGRYVGKKNLEDTILKTNLEAVQEIAYQLRLRNAGGIIILDLIDMEKEENKQRVYRALEEAIKKDRARPSILKISELGLVEMTRKRTRDTMVRALCEACPACEGRGFVKSKQTVAYEVMREIEREGIEREISKVLVQAHSDVIDILAIDERETLDHLERRYRKQIFLQAVPEYHQEQFEVVGDKKPRAEIGRDRERDRDRGRDSRRERGRRGGGDRQDRQDRQQQGGGRQNQQQSQPRPANAPRPLPVIINAGGSAAAPAPSAPVGEAALPVTESGNVAEVLAGTGGTSVAPAEGRLPVIISSVQPQPAGQEAATPPSDSGEHHDEYSEEDRLAFLRAQAAQDAALARLRANDPLGRNSRVSSGERSNDPQGGRRGQTRGRRGRRGAAGSGGGRGRNPRFGGRRDQAPGATDPGLPPGLPKDTGGNGNDDGGNGNPGNGGGDHSQPPT